MIVVFLSIMIIFRINIEEFNESNIYVFLTNSYSMVFLYIIYNLFLALDFKKGN